jgi:glycolate oxidase FAD binding subunit
METATPAKARQIPSEIQDEFRSLVSAENVRPASAGDGVEGAQPQLVVAPANEAELAAVLRCANDAGIAVIPRGGGTKMGWGNRPVRGELILSTARLSRVLDHAWADLTVSVEAGCTWQTLQETLAQHGQRLALDPLWPERTTVGGVLSTSDSGALRLRFGALRDLIIGVTIALPDGTLASSGGRVVKNVAGYDLPKLVTGAFGTLGIITRAIFRLYPVCAQSRTVSFTTSSLDEMQSKVLAIQDSKLAHVALQIRCGSGNGPPAGDVLLEGTEAGIAAQLAQLQKISGPFREQRSAIWAARENLWNNPGENSVVTRTSMLPASFAKTVRGVSQSAAQNQVTWTGVFQATGLGCIRLDGDAVRLASLLKEQRAAVEAEGGSLVILDRPKDLRSFDAWGSGGDALPLMRALKQRLDPKNTLNPGRFVGGI